MRFRSLTVAVMCATLVAGLAPAGLVVRAQQKSQPNNSARGDGTPSQRVSVMRSRLDNMRRSLNSALAAFNAGDEKDKKDKEKKSASESVTRLRGLEREAGQLTGEVTDIGAKIDRAEKFDSGELDKLEGAVADLNDRAEKALQETAGERRIASVGTPEAAKKKKKSGGGFLGIGHLFGHGNDEDKYAELMSGVKPGRDRELFEESAKLARKSNYEGARILFETIINTYPESPYLPHAKLAIADTFYLEGTTSALIQAGNAYQEWLTFFPTDPLADEVMLKAAEVEMRQMGLPDRDVTHARKAEQRLKALLQQFPQTSLRPEVQIRLNETQENLAMHTFSVGNFYMDKFLRGAAPNPKGAQSRYLEVVQKFQNFSRMDKALYLLAETYIAEEQPDEAVKYLQRILREHPDSEFVEKSTEQLDAIGAEKPTANQSAPKHIPPPDRGMMRRFLDQVVGAAPATIDKNGVLISKDSDTPALIDVIIENKGTLPVTTPTAPRSSTRIAPARPTAQPAPAPKKSPTPGAEGIKTQPTKTGQPATGSDPTKPQPPPPGV
ncbi:MAG: outer membrane protein assembly factor BamD [Acidobacteriota bacterium]|nr:outer membrane protein assembly factor BamD [Acidobacteriota bacterium]